MEQSFFPLFYSKSFPSEVTICVSMICGFHCPFYFKALSNSLWVKGFLFLIDWFSPKAYVQLCPHGILIYLPWKIDAGPSSKEASANSLHYCTFGRLTINAVCLSAYLTYPPSQPISVEWISPMYIRDNAILCEHKPSVLLYLFIVSTEGPREHITNIFFSIYF